MDSFNRSMFAFAVFSTAIVVACNSDSQSARNDGAPPFDSQSDGESGDGNGTAEAGPGGAKPDASAADSGPTTPPECVSNVGCNFVTFEAEDGVTIQGTLFGEGDKVIVLSHMWRRERSTWRDFADEAAARGYLALTYDFRGYGETGGTEDIPQIPVDTQAAYDFVSSQGASEIVLVGASMGGMASIKVAADAPTGLVGLVVIASPMEWLGLQVLPEDLTALTMPTLWTAGEGDPAAAVEAMHTEAAGPDKTLMFVEGTSAHGTDIFGEADTGPELSRQIFAFVERVMPL